MMTFKAGESGNPNGRPKGAISKRTQLAKLLEPRAEELIAKLIDLALNGDANALRLCIERLIPRATRTTVYTELPVLDSNKSTSSFEAIGGVLNGVLEGEISPDDGKKLIDMIEDHQRRIKNQKSSLRLDLGSL